MLSPSHEATIALLHGLILVVVLFILVVVLLILLVSGSDVTDGARLVSGTRVVVLLIVTIVIVGVLSAILCIGVLLVGLVTVLGLDSGSFGLGLGVGQLWEGTDLKAVGLLLHEGDVKGLEHQLPVKLVTLTLNFVESGLINSLEVTRSAL